MGKERTAATLEDFFALFGAERTGQLQFICSDMWRPYLQVIAAQASPKRQSDLEIVLLQAGDEQKNLVGKKCNCCRRTNEYHRKAATLEKRGVKFLSKPQKTT